MTHVITTYGGGELFELVFNGIATLFNKDAGVILPLMNLSLMVGAVYVTVLMLFRSSLTEGLHWLLWVIVATNLICLPKTRIHIHDPMTKFHREVDNVPLALGLFAGLVSNVGKSVTEAFESRFSLPNYMPYHETGTVFASSLMSQVGQFRIVDAGFKGNMERFINQCVVYDAMIGYKYTVSDLQNTSDIWSLVKAKASPILGFLYKDENAPGVILSCKEGAQKLNALWTNEIDKATAHFGSTLHHREFTKAAFFTHLQNGYQLLTNVSANASSILQQELMIHAIEEASNNKLSELGSPHNYAATKALLQQRSAYAIAGDIAARTLPLFKNVIEALSYSLFIFIVVLALMPNGYRILMTYFGILVWTQLWAPLYAVLNLIMTLYGKAETSSLAANKGLTILNSSAIVNANADMITLAAWLSVSIPFISYGILKQGAGAFVGLAQHLGSAMQTAASGAASEAVSGNMSMGNVSLGTEAYQNTTAFQHNTSPSYNASHFKAMNTSGIEQATFADGTQTFSDQAISRLGVQIMGAENTSFATQESYNQARSVAQNTSLAASEALENSFQKSTNFLSQVTKGLSSGKDWTSSLSASEAKSLQNFKSYVEDIRQSQHLSEAQALEAALGAKLGVDFMGFGGSFGGSFSNSETFQKAVEGAKHLATQQNYGDNLERILSAAQSFSENANESSLQELGRGATASLNQAQSLREEASIARSKMETLSRDLSSGQSQSFTLNKDLTQEVLTFIAHQPLNRGPLAATEGIDSPTNIGYERARQILEQGGEERASYIEHFLKDHPQYQIGSIGTPQAEARLSGSYQNEVRKIQDNSRLNALQQKDHRSVMYEGIKAGLNPSGLEYRENQAPNFQKAMESKHSESSSKVQQQAETFITATTKKITDGHTEINQKEQALQKEKDTAEKKSIVGPPSKTSQERTDYFEPPLF